MDMQNSIKFHQFVHKILSRKKNFDNTKGHNSLVNLQKLTCNNLNLDLGKVNAYAKINQIPSIHSEDTKQKGNFDNNQGPYLCCKFAKFEA